MENAPIRILQRPCQTSDNQALLSIKPQVTVKTLEQREADYAAARRRIMGSDAPESEGEDSGAKGVNKTLACGNSQNGCSISRQPSTTNSNTTTATPLMSIQATPAASNALVPDFGPPALSTVLTSQGVAQPRVTNPGAARQGFAVVNVAQKLQQQQHTVPNVTRPVIHTQPQRLLTASASSPSFFSNPRTTAMHQSVPLFPVHGNAANAGLLPTPPGFNYSVQNATLNATAGGGMHHSHSAAYALMQQFGLFQQHYQQALNGFQNQLIPPTASHSGASLSPFNFSIASQSVANQKFTNSPTFN